MNIYLKPKIFRALKLSTLCLILGVEAGFATESYSQKTTFTISVQDQSVKEIFDYIEQHSEFIIFYLDVTIDVNRKVSVNLKDQRVESWNSYSRIQMLCIPSMIGRYFFQSGKK